MAVAIDTDVMIDFLRGHPKAVALVEANAEVIILSAVVVAELYAGVREGAEQAMLDELVAHLRVEPVTDAIAAAAGLLKRDYGKSHGVGLGDAIVAATALAHNAALLTLNTRHYPMLRNLKAAYVKKQ